MRDCYITYAKRTPIGKLGKSLAAVRPDDMMSYLLDDFKAQEFFDLELIDDVIVGCANQAGEDNRNIARMAVTLAQFPMSVPGTTINRLCGSSLDALIGAWGRISTNLAECILVGGVESMSRAPYVLSKAQTAYAGNQTIYNTTLGWRFPNPRMKKLFPLWAMGETAEEVARKFSISREDQDQFALESHQKAAEARSKGLFQDEILPVEIVGRKQTTVVDQDEGPRLDTSLEKLSTLRAVFDEKGTVTAGNSSSLNDGAAALCVVSESFLKQYNLTPLARVTGAGVRGVHPNTMGLGPIEATKVLCQKYQKKVSDFDIVELNEAFAAQSLACIRELELDPQLVNQRGGAIALGHPLGCSGARIVTTMLGQMKSNSKLVQGLATMCIGVGQGIAVSLENCHS